MTEVTSFVKQVRILITGLSSRDVILAFRKDGTPGFFQSRDTAQQAPSLGKQFYRHAQAYNRCGDTDYPRDTAWYIMKGGT